MTQEKTPFGEGATEEKIFNTPILDEFQGIESIYEYESPQCKDRLKVICLILAVDQVAKNNNLQTATGSIIFFYSRVLHYFIYVFGIPYLRTALFFFSLTFDGSLVFFLFGRVLYRST